MQLGNPIRILEVKPEPYPVPAVPPKEPSPKREEVPA